MRPTGAGPHILLKNDHITFAPVAGTSHLRHGGGGSKKTPPVTREPKGLERSGKVQSIARQNSHGVYFATFLGQVNIEVTRGQPRSNS